MGIQNKVALVTGGSQGIGKAISEKLLQSGAAVAIAALDDEALEKTGSQFKARGFTFKVYGLDLTDETRIPGLAAAVARELGPVEILINNAGITGPTAP